MSHTSVTIPLFNHARFIGRTIESVLNQQLRELDIVVVDDCSTDDSFEVASQYASDPRVRCVRNEKNLGVAGNWNRCIELARGPLVMVFGSDDLLDPDYLAEADRIFEQHPQVGLVYSPVRTIDASDRVTHAGEPHTAALYRAGDEAVAALIKTGICTVTTIFRRGCYETLGHYDEKIWNGPDVEFVTRIAAHNDVYDMGKVCGSVRVHGAKMGHLGYLRRELLDSYLYGLSKIWGHLSPEGVRQMGIQDLDAFIAQDGFQFALSGALVMLANGRPDMARYYLRRAAGLDAGWWKRPRFWRAFGLSLAPPLGQWVMRRRMRIA